MALVAIALVLSAVFLPMVFFGGSTGVIYRQFSATIVSAMASVGLHRADAEPRDRGESPAAHPCDGRGNLGSGALLPKVAHTLERGRLKFNNSFDRLVHWYVGYGNRVVDRKWLFLGIYAGVVVILALLFVRLPTGFLPTEDQGAALVQFRLPAGATTTRTAEVQRAVENYFLNGPEKKNVRTYFTVAGGGQGAAGQNTGQAFINLADYDQRPGKQNSADAIVARASAAFRGSARCSGLRARSRRNSRAWPIDRLHDGDPEHRRHERTGFRRGPRQAARSGDGRSQADFGSPQRIARRRQPQGEHRSAAASGARSQCGRRQQHNLGRLGWTLRQRLHRPRHGSSASMCRGTRLIAPNRATSANGMSATTRAAMVPFSSFAQTSWTTTPTSLSRFLGYPFLRALGSGRGRASAPATR